MAPGSTLYRFKIALSDVSRSVYQALDFRVAMHPSETAPFLLTRVLAYALNFEEGLEFSADLSTQDEPALRKVEPSGGTSIWIEVGNPAARRLHKASKASKLVRVYTYKDPENLKKELSGEQVHRAEQIGIFSFEPSFLKNLADTLERDNSWTLIHDDGELIVTIGEQTWMSQLGVHRLD